MDECRTVAKFIILGALIGVVWSASIDTASADPNLVNIVDDVIPDVENSTQKVIRVNTVDLPALAHDDSNTADSSLYNIQPLLTPPAYVSSRKFRKQKNVSSQQDPPIIIQPYPELKLKKSKKQKQKQLHMLFKQDAYDGKSIAKRMKVRVAPGAYPIYYVVAKTNGEFHKQPIKGFRNEREMVKYFDKVEKIGKLDAIGS